MGRLDGKTAIISGGARGQGAEEARLFASEGASVVIGDIRDELGAQVEAEIRELGGAADYVHLDVTQEDDWRRAVEFAESKYGGLNVLVNNAGIVTWSAIDEMPVEEWDLVMAVNMRGVFLGSKHSIPAMIRAGGGSIINISSAAGIAPASPSSSAYAASKGGVRLFTKATAVQHAKDNIRCNSVHPGPIDTPMVQETRMARPDEMAARMERVPLGRMGESSEIAYGVLFLASDESSYMTGSEMVIDGGRTAM